MAGFESRTLSVFINIPVQKAYAFISVPENFPKWASGLCQTIRKADNVWIAETPLGAMRVRFTENNKFGVLDHYIMQDTGEEIYVPMRVIPNGRGCELIFTLFQLPGMSDAKFREDAEWVAKDLKAIKDLLESA